MCQEAVKVSARSLAFHVNRYRNCHFYRLSITTEKFEYSLSRKAYRDRNTPWNTCEMTLSTIVGLKGKKLQKKKTNKQNELNTWEEIYKTTYSRYQSTYKSPFAFDKIQSRIILLLLGMKIRRKPNSDNTEKPAKRLILTMILKLLNYRTWSVQMFYWCSAELVGN